MILLGAAAAGCSPEKRSVGPSIPLSAPAGVADARAKFYESNAWEVSEGTRQFRWMGCGDCHDGASGTADLTDKAWRYGGATAEIYGSISGGRPGMPAYGGRASPEQIWRMAGYLHGLPDLPSARRARQDSDQKGEPSGARWNGPVS